jgi:alpha-L-fucosidase 2
MALQGVWTADNGKLPPWKGDYHHNLNTQISYVSYMKSNHIPEGECFVDYLLSLEAKAEDFARRFYGIDEGLCLPSVMDIEGNALGGWPMYAMNPSNIAWLCDCIADLYDYTKDIVFLREKAYPFIKKFGIFLSKLLERNDDGYFVLPFSSSPEAHDNTARSFLTPNSSYDLALIRNVYEDLIRFSEILNYKEDNEFFKSMLSGFETMYLDENSSLMISRDEKMFESHHMVSHLISIHPLRQLDYGKEADRRIIDESMSFYDSFGYYLYVGYTFAQKGEIYAIQRDGKKAYEMLKLFWEDFCLPNGFHCNGDYKDKYQMLFKYRPFTLEGNMCAIDVLQEMLLQDHHGDTVIAPAIPSNWNNLSYKLRSKNGVIIEVIIENGELSKATLTAYADAEFPVYFKDRFLCHISLKKGETVTI